jgi:isochorismate synthase
MIDLHLPSAAHSLHVDHAALLAVLRAAQRQARATQSSVLASFTQASPLADTLALFAAAETLECDTAFYWAHPRAQQAMAGIGAAATIEGEHIAGAASQWHHMLEHAQIDIAPGSYGDSSELAGPRCFGGFAFDPASPRSHRWDGFPNGLLILPQLHISAIGKQCSLTLNALVGADDDAEREALRLTALLDRLAAAMEQQRFATQPLQFTTRNLQPQSDWWQMIEAATAAIQRGAYRKVVLARSVEAKATEPFVAAPTLRQLREQYADAHIFALRRERRTFLGATPEQLARVVDGRVETMALAGSAPRGASPAEDDALGEALRRQTKTRNEHQVVGAMIRRALEPLTRSLSAPEEPQLFRLPNVQHLLTPITGELLPGVTALDVAAALHPTPAVAGDPRDVALAEIRRIERFDRGWYAGPVGWVGADGSGEFAVALRSALIEGDRATLFAGCGIVAGSKPQAEYDETCWKLQVMLRSLGGED